LPRGLDVLAVGVEAVGAVYEQHVSRKSVLGARHTVRTAAMHAHNVAPGIDTELDVIASGASHHHVARRRDVSI
jgi:hypothetical protein